MHRNSVRLFDHGYVALDSHNATDLSVVNAARASFNARQEDLDDKGRGLINFLMRERHATPFEHNSFTFIVRAPLFVVREWQRHRIGSYNEESGRYSKLSAEFYVPTYVRTQKGKPGGYTFEPVSEDVAVHTRSAIADHSQSAFALYQELLDNGVAKEVARMVLPVNIYSTFYWTVNARSLMNFLRLRNSEFAQYEICQYAKVIERFFAETMPVTYTCFEANGRQTP